MSTLAPADPSVPPQPRYILRGHSAQVHNLCFLRQNTRLLTGDADGWVVLWNVASKRPVAVWRAHTKGILGLGVWRGTDSILTHGRDNKLRVWKLSATDEAGLDSTLPIEDPVTHRPTPWLQHALLVNALNFCSFAQCHEPESCQLLFAVPGIKEGEIALQALPTESLHSYIKLGPDEKTGIIMSLRLFHAPDANAQYGRLTLIAAYESGMTTVMRWSPETRLWTRTSTTTLHSQPVLSIDTSPDLSLYYSSGTDAILARHRIDAAGQVCTDSINTKHSGQQSLRVRSDGRIMATAGWDGRIRVYSTSSLQLLAVLKWHREGCYALAFADLDPVADNADQDVTALSLTPQSPSVPRSRTQQEQETHWLAAGSKDGKVSLWDIY